MQALHQGRATGEGGREGGRGRAGGLYARVGSSAELRQQSGSWNVPYLLLMSPQRPGRPCYR
eukprot:SAG31_NODE_4612_length_3097_cov_2.555704_5_plen_62_part_00